MIRLFDTGDQSVTKKRHHDDMDCGGGGASHANIQTGMNNISAAQSILLVGEFREMLDMQKSQNNEFASMLQEFKIVLNEIKQKQSKTEPQVKFDYYA
jgi:hypothetical protein